MVVDKQVIHKIEEIFDFNLYNEQKEYLLNDNYYWQGGRRSGKTFAYCIKLALSEGYPLDFTKNQITDESHGTRYNIWFKQYF